jgi:hypothetical protein
MPRTTSALVQGVLAPGKDYDLVNQPDLTPFIATASSLVDQVVSLAFSNRGFLIDGNTAELIERWLAAHFYCVSDQTYQSKSTAGASASFQGQADMGLESNRYGQSAVRIDWTGTLNALNKQLLPTGFWAGRPPSAQTPYVDRN